LSTQAKVRQAQERLIALLDEKAKRAGREAFLPFVVYTMPSYEVNWHHKILAEKLDLFARGMIQNLLIELPPQHGKSELTSRRLPAYILGHDRRKKIVVASYSADLATSFNRDIQRIIISDEYKRLFPKTRIGEKNVKNASQGSFLRNQDQFETVCYNGKPGFVKTTGVCGSLTGTPVDVAIIDDPIKDAAQAHSKTYRDSVWEWYCSVFKTRLHNGSQTLLTLTRWHEDDLAGRILKSKEAIDWDVVCLRGIREDEPNTDDHRAVGEALWESRHSRERLLAAKERNPGVFAALYQQRPAPPEGAIILPKWFGRFTELPKGARITLSVDATFKGEGKGEIDFVAIQAWAEVGNKFYLVDTHRERAGFVRTLEIIRALYKKHNCNCLLIEDKANGSAIVDVLKRELNGVIPIEPSGGKMARAFAAQPALEAGQVLIPAVAQWVEEFLQECREFPAGAHDDQIDAMTQAINYFVGRGSAGWAANLRF